MSKLNIYEGTMLITTLLCAKIFISYPLLGENFSGFEILFINIAAFLIVYTILNAALKVSFGNEKIRNVLSALIFITIVVFLSFSFCAYVRSLKFSLLYNSPEGFISFIIVPAIVIGALSGIKSLGKMCAVFTPAILIITAVFMLFSCRFLDSSSLFPVFGEGIGVFPKYIIILLSSLWESIFVMFLPEFVKDEKSIKKIVLYSLLISFFFFAFTGVIFNINGIKKATEYSEIFKTIRLIKPTSSMERPDSVFYIIYVFLMLLYMSISVFFAKHIFKTVFKITYSEVLIVPLCLIISLFAVTGLDSGFSLLVYKGVFSVLWCFAFLSPLLNRGNKT